MFKFMFVKAIIIAFVTYQRLVRHLPRMASRRMARKGARRPYCQKVAAGDAVHSGWTAVVTLPSYTWLHTCAFTWLHAWLHVTCSCRVQGRAEELAARSAAVRVAG